MPTQLIAAMDLPTAARAAMRIAVDSDDPRPLLYAAQLLIDACMDPDNEASSWLKAMPSRFALAEAGAIHPSAALD